MNISAFGYKITVEKDITPKQKGLVKQSNEILQKYKSGKENLETRIIENEEWYKSQHWKYIRKQQGEDNPREPEPVSGYLFSTLHNKHADAMDNFPSQNILPREQDDIKEAEILTSIIPVELEQIKYRKVYSDNWWEKLKNGTAVYYIGWDSDTDMIGDVDISDLDLLSIFWEPGVDDVQDSMNLFIVDLVNDQKLKQAYEEINLAGSKTFDPKRYATTDNLDISNMSLVIDRYHHLKNSEGEMILRYFKYVESNILYDSMDDPEHPEYAEEGYYWHGKYPVEFDVLFPEKGSPAGFGYVDVLKNPQIYIDKLDQIISENALMAGKKRWFLKNGSGVNENELLDWGKPIIHVDFTPDKDHIMEFTVNQLDGSIATHRQNKIGELKEVAGSNEFNRGEGGKGVTAASAILALQEAGNKLSRDMIGTSYLTHQSIIYFVIELFRQFYDETRTFRIDSDKPGQKYEFVQYNNERLKPQERQAPTGEPVYRTPILDIKVVAEKKSPFSQAAHNELAKEMYAAGFFDPARAEQALIALEMMKFEGKETIKEKIMKHAQLYQAAQQLAVAIQENQKMRLLLQKITGEDLGAGMEQMSGGAQQ